MSKSNSTLTAERLREVLHYEPSTGVFIWKIRTSNRVKINTQAGSTCKDGYTEIGILGERYGAHMLAFLYMRGTWPPEDIDHQNGMRSDNRFENLRDLTRSGNLQNQRGPRSNNKSGFLGVSPNRKRWAATIILDRKKTHLGTFDTPQEAHEAYLRAKRKLHPACTI